MKITTCLYTDDQYLALIDDTTALLPALASDASVFDSVLAFIDDADRARSLLDGFSASQQSRATVALSELRLLAPIPRPRKNVMCLGWNYSEHVHETSRTGKRGPDLPEHPIVFTKSVTSVTGPGRDIPMDSSVSSQLDWEVELGVIIGRGGRGISRADALAHIFGYTVINDISARDLQFRHKQFFIGKSLDGACPMGPWIVTADGIEDPQQLDLRCTVNGVAKQDSNTRHMIFDIPEIIATLSRGMTLEAGDIIATGTPDGVGFARTPPEYLRPGDEVVCEIEGVGVLVNRIAAV